MERLTKTMQDTLNKIPDRGLREVVAKLGATVLERQNQLEGKRSESTAQETDDSGQEEVVDLKSIPPEKRFPSREHYLPEWSDNKRGVPNTVLRGALFPAIQGKARESPEGRASGHPEGRRNQIHGLATRPGRSRCMGARAAYAHDPEGAAWRADVL